LDSCICCDDGAESDVGMGMGSCGISGRSCFVAVSRWCLAMNRGLLGCFSISFMTLLISVVGSSVCASVFRNWNASVSSWYPADSVMLTAFWSFSVSVAVVVICCGFLRSILYFFYAKLVCVLFWCCAHTQQLFLDHSNRLQIYASPFSPRMHTLL
jgi:hypothetical protein